MSSLQTETVERARRLRQVRRFLDASLEDLQRHQVAALNRVLDAAMRAAPYARLYRARPRIERLEDLRELPVVERSHLAPLPPEERATRGGPDLEPQPSTGTTGETMMSLRSPEEIRYQEALGARHFLAQGFPPHTRQLVLDFSLDPAAPLHVRGTLGRVSGWAPVETQAEAVRSFNPEVLSSATSILLELGEFMGEFPVQALMTFGELLTAADRQELKRYFEAEAFDFYSASETGHISWECPRRTGYHVNADAVVIEVLDDYDRPVPVGETGHLVLTSLWNPTMPVIRYRLGDLGALLPHPCPCPCPISLPLMAQVEGRVVDRLLAHDGRRISPMRFALVTVGPYHSAIRRWRVVQRAVDDLLVEIVWTAEPITDLAERMSKSFARALAGPVNVEIRGVEGFSTPRGRKFRPVESLVP